MNDKVTVCTPFKNARNCLELMYRSMRLNEGRFLWHVADGGSFDGANEFARKHADLLLNVPAGQNWNWAFDNLAMSVQTPLILFVDSDVEVLSPIVEDMIDLLVRCDALAVCSPYPKQGECKINDWRLQSQTGWALHFCLFDSKKLASLLRYWTFGVYLEPIGGRYYDGGHMLFNASRSHGMRTLFCDEVSESVLHYGGMSALFSEGEPPESTARRQHVYDVATTRLGRFGAAQDCVNLHYGISWTKAGWIVP